MSITVLHVDDDPMFGDLVASYLDCEDDITVESTAGASAAMDRLRRTDVDCVVSDYDMPGTNGLELLAEVRTVCPEVPFILFTGKGSEEIASDAINNGVTDYLQKGGGVDKFDVLRNSVRNAVSRYQGEHELMLSRRFIERVLKLSPAAILVFDREGTVVQANERAEGLLGVEASELVGRSGSEPGWEVVDEKRAPVSADPFFCTRVLETGETVSDVVRGVRQPDGRLAWLSVSAAPLWDDADAIENVIAVMADVTDQHRRERALADTLKQFDGFASVLSHDLGNVLAIAQGRLELAERTGDASHLEQVERALERSVGLLEDLTTVMRSGSFVDEIGDVDARAVFEAAWETQETKRATFETEPLAVRADENALLRMFENLIRNALEHGTDTVAVRLGRLDDGFYVEDDGDGIPAADRDRVFDPGYSTKAGGTGFGLVSIQQIAFAHGWTIAVADSPDGGARFEFSDVTLAD
ncbi:response regulator [Halogeometricum luteum]|uniref:histidine kinase n=1 Tax=Halogeometricum luteum TaxID=2950537 RepID=A0ABU2G328_9EURY|nr:response regulator [Halogeometricum sp. S3BR5-2]MDS0295196.1 response regulator [Halogeometricum sp. S3BR5-2]